MSPGPRHLSLAVSPASPLVRLRWLRCASPQGFLVGGRWQQGLAAERVERPPAGCTPEARGLGGLLLKPCLHSPRTLGEGVSSRGPHTLPPATTTVAAASAGSSSPATSRALSSPWKQSWGMFSLTQACRRIALSTAQPNNFCANTQHFTHHRLCALVFLAQQK